MAAVRSVLDSQLLRSHLNTHTLLLSSIQHTSTHPHTHTHTQRTSCVCARARVCDGLYVCLFLVCVMAGLAVWHSVLLPRKCPGGLDRDEVRAAVAVWYPAPFRRRRLDDLEVSDHAKVGRTRRAVAAQLHAHKHEVDEAITQQLQLQKRRASAITRSERQLRRSRTTTQQHKEVAAGGVTDELSHDADSPKQLMHRAISAPVSAASTATGGGDPQAHEAALTGAAPPVDLLSDLPERARDSVSREELHDLMVSLNQVRAQAEPQPLTLICRHILMASLAS
jgi:hypothetical protein